MSDIAEALTGNAKPSACRRFGISSIISGCLAWVVLNNILISFKESFDGVLLMIAVGINFSSDCAQAGEADSENRRKCVSEASHKSIPREVRSKADETLRLLPGYTSTPQTL